MIKLVEEFKGEVVVVAVSGDDSRDDLESFAKAFGLPKPGFMVVWDRSKSVMDLYGVGKLPESYIDGKEYSLIRTVLGIENWATAGAFEYFRQLLAKDGSGGAPVSH